jgi:hypothetical protein
MTMAVIAVAAFACFGASVGEVVYVYAQSVCVRDGKHAYSKLLATAVQGQALTVTAEEGDWMKVRLVPVSQETAVEGFIFVKSLNQRPTELTTTAPTGSAAEVGAAGATRGLLDADAYAKSKGLDEDPFYKLVLDSHGTVTDANFEAFTLEGKIGPHNPSAKPDIVPSTNPNPLATTAPVQ